MKNGLTIGIPVYNEEGRIERAIRCAAHQCEKLIVADNASTDGTRSVCEKLLEQFPNMNYIRHSENIGAIKNWSFIAEKTDTPYLMFLGSHDHIEKDYVGKVLPALENDATIEVATGELCFDYDSQTEPVTSYNNWAGGMEKSTYARVRAFLFDRAHLAWCIYGIFRTASFRKYYTDDLPVYGVDIIFLTRMLKLGRCIIVKGTRYFAWIRNEKCAKTDYLERVVVKKHASRQRFQMRNEFRVAEHQAIMDFFPSASFLKRLGLRFQTMVRFGTFRKPGLDPLFFLLYIPVKLARKFDRASRWAQHDN
jgi:glycosyltransferase involved in cell wall biosynthesis